MRKAVITILGTIGSTFDKKVKKLVLDKQSIKSNYYSKNIKSMLKDTQYTNTLPLILNTYAKEYEIIPIFTQIAKEIQKEVLSKLENMRNSQEIFKDEYLIKDENNFKDILDQIDTILNQYDKVIIDISHGFRHLPILMTIDLIMQHIKDNQKIERILFAQEEIKPDKFAKRKGRYEIVDLRDYLDLANLSFIITNFKDNYTISSNIKISNAKYRELIHAMREFSRDILALSMQHFFYTSLPNLKKAIADTENDFILKNDLKKLEEHLKVFHLDDKKKYQVYFSMAKELMSKEYLLQSINLVHEAKLLYLKSAFKSKNLFNYELIEAIERKKGKTYTLLSECKYIYTSKKIAPDRVKEIQIQNANKLKSSLEYNHKFAQFVRDDLRNSLAHADSEQERENVKNEIAKNIQQFEQLCIESNILGVKQL